METDTALAEGASLVFYIDEVGRFRPGPKVPKLGLRAVGGVLLRRSAAEEPLLREALHAPIPWWTHTLHATEVKQPIIFGRALWKQRSTPSTHAELYHQLRSLPLRALDGDLKVRRPGVFRRLERAARTAYLGILTRVGESIAARAPSQIVLAVEHDREGEASCGQRYAAMLDCAIERAIWEVALLDQRSSARETLQIVIEAGGDGFSPSQEQQFAERCAALGREAGVDVRRPHFVAGDDASAGLVMADFVLHALVPAWSHTGALAPPLRRGAGWLRIQFDAWPNTSPRIVTTTPGYLRDLAVALSTGVRNASAVAAELDERLAGGELSGGAPRFVHDHLRGRVRELAAFAERRAVMNGGAS